MPKPNLQNVTHTTQNSGECDKLTVHLSLPVSVSEGTMPLDGVVVRTIEAPAPEETLLKGETGGLSDWGG